jgi:hypothetical protein
LLEQVEELAPEDLAEGLNREQEVISSCNPTTLVKRQGTARDQTVEMEVVAQGLVPGVEYGEKADLPPQNSRKTSASSQRGRFVSPAASFSKAGSMGDSL